ncbi:agmatine deiminase family protein [Saccharospirillum impatiens]|uniref:agmatine deiminase family protein n=1 Tax=Saccharospirillum impatiens TaxID=169438 RepID=UPI00040DCAB0|nr:agmatine deiminase family protein [Saccharospirillum impatiens]
MSQRYLPAEWYPQDAILITWPHPDSDWADVLADAEDVYLDLLSSLSHTQDVVIQVHASIDTDRLKVLFERDGINQARCHLVLVDGNDTWARDHGPITVLEDDQPRLLNFRFNGWGDKFNASDDNALNQTMSDKGLFAAPMQSIDWVLEGGSIESDGRGTLLTTTACVLNPNRNGDTSRQTLDKHLKTWFGSQQILWLENGALAGDDTDAHIDTLARFAPEGILVFQGCQDENDAHFEQFSAMKRELTAFTDASGNPYRLIELPWPDAQFNQQGQRLPATYANFLVANQILLVPTYSVPQDGAALERLAEAFPDHRVVGIPCLTLIEQFGSLHCITMQLPKGTLSQSLLDSQDL